MMAYMNKFEGISFQHLEYTTIKSNKDYFLIDFEKLTVMTCVRNPYTRLLSDLFYFKLITETTPPDIIYEIVRDYIAPRNRLRYDNHPLPQYKFLLDEDGSLLKEITILHMETVVEEMASLGYDDFHENVNKGPVEYGSDYKKYFNKETIALVQSHYARDFEYFGYTTA
jgi:hypothetical protein